MLFLMGAFLSNVNVKAAINPISPESELLSNDAEFAELTNAIINFSAQVYVHKKSDALNRYLQNTATEDDIKGIIEAAGVKDKEGLQMLFQRITDLKKKVNERYSFMANNQKGQSIVSEATMTLAKRGKIEKVKLPDVDCLASFMAAFGLCYWAYDICINNGQPENSCAIAVTACLAMTFISANECFGLGLL